MTPSSRARVIALSALGCALASSPGRAMAHDPAAVQAPAEGEVPMAPVPEAAAPMTGAEQAADETAPQIEGTEAPDATAEDRMEGPGTDDADDPAEGEEDADEDLVRVELHRNLAPPDGKRMLIAGGVLMGVGFLGQMTALGTIRRTCANTPIESIESDDYGSAVTCGLGFTGGALLLFFSGIPELVGAPWIVAGATFRGRAKAFDDHFFVRREKGMPQRGFIWGGAGMIAGGALSWIISPRIAMNSCRSNPSLTCSVDATTWGWNIGLGLMTAGGAMLGRGLAYRRNFNRYRMLNPISVAPAFGQGMTGMAISGRF